MAERPKANAVLFRGKPIAVEGRALAVGDAAPVDFTLTANDMSAVRGSALGGQLRVICAVPSLDTPVCDIEMKRLNREIEKLPAAKLYAVSMDLPFAQSRWCLATGSDRVQALSDFKDRSFGPAHGAFSPELGLLVRAVFVIGKDDRVCHVEYVGDVTNEPDYAAALAALRSAG
jgi:thioredoxin-dependent peroxiredoxin